MRRVVAPAPVFHAQPDRPRRQRCAIDRVDLPAGAVAVGADPLQRREPEDKLLERFPADRAVKIFAVVDGAARQLPAAGVGRTQGKDAAALVQDDGVNSQAIAR